MTYESIEASSRSIYRAQPIDIATLLTKKCKKWEERIGMEIGLDHFVSQFKSVYVVTNIAKLRSFQFRLLQNAIITNLHLYKWGIKDHPNYSFCGEEFETYNHMFIFCAHTKELWLAMESFMRTISKDKIHFAMDTVYWNRLIKSPAGHIKNFICLVMKHYIYWQRCLKKALNVFELIRIIKHFEQFELHYAVKNNKLFRHQQKWCLEHKNDNN